MEFLQVADKFVWMSFYEGTYGTKRAFEIAISKGLDYFSFEMVLY